MKKLFLTLFISLFSFSCNTSEATLKITDFKENTKPDILYKLKNEKDITNKLTNIRQNFQSITIKDKIYLLGGDTTAIISSENESYNLFDFTAKQNASLQTLKTSFGISYYDNKIYTIGGYLSGLQTNDVSVYDISKNLWEKKTPLQIKRSGLSVVQTENKFYAIGGFIGSGSWSNDLEIYDTKEDFWIKLNTMKKPRSNHASILIKDKIYVFGGENETGVLNSVEEYSIKFDRWKQKNPIPEELSSAKVFNIDDYIILLGGKNKDKKASKSVYIYNTTNDKWIKSEDLNQTLDGFGLAVDEKNKKLYVLGGLRNGVISDKITSYDIDS
ncbi:MAG: kelch repeat-containing protein [Candidatus Sericytochromatia bacterium]